MFDHTRASVDHILMELRRFVFGFRITVQSVYIVYLLFAIFVPMGNLAVNIVLLAIGVGYLIFTLIFDLGEERRERQTRVTVRRWVNYTKLVLKAYALGVVIYTAVISLSHATPISLLMPALTSVLFLIQVIFEIVLYYVESRAQLLFDSMTMDLEPITKPVAQVGAFIKRVKGEEIEERRELGQKRRRFVEKALAAFREKKAKQKAQLDAKKAEARQRKKEEDAARREEKRRLHNAKRLEHSARKEYEKSTKIDTISEAEQMPVAAVGARDEGDGAK